MPADQIPDPPTFSKGRAKYCIFRAKLEGKLLGDSHKFRNAAHQQSYAMGFLAGDAHEMTHTLRLHGEISTVKKLLECPNAACEDPDWKGTAERELCSLRQGNPDFASHDAKLQSILAVRMCGFSLLHSFYNSLSHSIARSVEY